MKILETNKKYNYQVLFDKERNLKIFKSKEYNYIFNMKTGVMYSWGKTFNDDPVFAPAPNILDCEITGCCTGLKNDGVVCPFCYKSNTPTSGSYMTFGQFKHIIDVYPKSLTQVALGADACLTCNPDIWKMMEYCRENYIIPNVTLANVLNDEIADNLKKYCGAVAISRYDDADICYDSIKKLTDRRMTQVNIHLLFAEEYYERCKQTIIDAYTDSRLEKLNAIVCLGLKQKGRGTSFHRMSDEHFKELVNLAKEHNVGLGFDSCNSLRAIRTLGKEIQNSVLDCEAGLQSSYINYRGYYFPCSFCEGKIEYFNTIPFSVNDSPEKEIHICFERLDWSNGLNVLKCNSTEEFLDKIWYDEKTEHFRNVLKKTSDCNECNCRTCPMYEV